MTTRYVGPGGSDSNNGLSWATRKLTLNGVEDTPVVAGDTVYVAPGTYRETLTVDVSGSSGSLITYIGDYDGSHTDGVGGVVRITGSDDDIIGTRSSCISLSSKNYRTFLNFYFDTVVGGGSNSNILATSPTYLTISNCMFQSNVNTGAINISGSGQANNTIQNCFFHRYTNLNTVTFTHSSTVNDTNQVVQNCIFLGNTYGADVVSIRVGGITIKNCVSLGSNVSFRVQTALASGQVMTVNNCILFCPSTGLAATTTAEFVEDYNTFFGAVSNRSNVSTGANSLSYPPLFASRWFFQLVNAGAGPNSPTQLVTPFDLSSFSLLINIAGTSPTTTDMRGTAVQGSQREWGALEYDSTLKIKGGGGISRARAQ